VDTPLAELNKRLDTLSTRVGWLDCYQAVLLLAAKHSDYLPPDFVKELRELEQDA
jgi:hypothetical protein